MTIAERQAQSIQKEIEKYTKSKERYEGILEKKIALCEKLGCLWTDEEYRERITELHKRHEGESIVHFGNDDDIITQKQNSAWFDKEIATSNLEDTQRRLENAEKRLAKLIPPLESEEEGRKESERMTNMETEWLSKTAEERKAEYEAWLKKFKADCLKDGVIINEASNHFINGITKSGKKFSMSINSGYTVRSIHCYTLYIDGEVIFTSGDFSTGYRIIKR